MAINYPADGNSSCYQVEDNSFWFVNRNKIIKRTVAKFLKSNANFIDLGGGNGYVSKMLQDQCLLNVILVEPGDGVARARERGVFNVLQGTEESLESLELSNFSIGLFDVVEHISNDYTFLKTIYSQQKSNDYIFITVPAFKFMWSFEDDEAGHVKRYHSKNIQELLSKVGYEVVECNYFFMSLLMPIFLFRVLPYRMNIRRRENASSDDHAPGGIFYNIINFFLLIEEKLMINKIKLPLGASLMVVARRK